MSDSPDRDHLLRERLGRLQLGPRPSRQELYAHAIEIATLLTVSNPRQGATAPDDQVSSQIAALTGRIGPNGAYIPYVDPLGCQWNGTTFFYFVAGLVFASPSARPRWSEGPSMSALMATKKSQRPRKGRDGG